MARALKVKTKQDEVKRSPALRVLLLPLILSLERDFGTLGDTRGDDETNGSERDTSGSLNTTLLLDDLGSNKAQTTIEAQKYQFETAGILEDTKMLQKRLPNDLIHVDEVYDVLRFLVSKTELVMERLATNALWEGRSFIDSKFLAWTRKIHESASRFEIESELLKRRLILLRENMTEILKRLQSGSSTKSTSITNVLNSNDLETYVSACDKLFRKLALAKPRLNIPEISLMDGEIQRMFFKKMRWANISRWNEKLQRSTIKNLYQYYRRIIKNHNRDDPLYDLLRL